MTTRNEAESNLLRTRMPAIFAAHGAPILLDDAAWMSELAAWATTMPRPKSILMVSAHWEKRPTSLGATRPVRGLDHGAYDPAMTKAAYACFDELLTTFSAEGYGTYRVNTAFMDKVADSYGPVQRRVHRTLKAALDPNGILAPGKSGIRLDPPKGAKS